MTSVAVVIPASIHDDVHRRQARDWVTTRYHQVHAVPVTVGVCTASTWSKGEAVNAELEAATADVVVVADGDSYVSAPDFDAGVAAAQKHGWAMPHSTVKRLTLQSTHDVVNGRDVPPKLAKATYNALPGGGIVMATRDTWATVRGFDPRFRGWGGEDHALGLALMTLVAPHARRTRAPLWHLWHPPAADAYQPSDDTRVLDGRYRRARRNPDAMRDLIGEW